MEGQRCALAGIEHSCSGGCLGSMFYRGVPSARLRCQHGDSERVLPDSVSPETKHAASVHMSRVGRDTWESRVGEEAVQFRRGA